MNKIEEITKKYNELIKLLEEIGGFSFSSYSQLEHSYIQMGYNDFLKYFKNYTAKKHNEEYIKISVEVNGIEFMALLTPEEHIDRVYQEAYFRDSQREAEKWSGVQSAVN